jgi:hypothetical protein
MKAHTIVAATIVLLLMAQISSRGQNPSNQTINAKFLHCGWNRSSSDQCCYSVADFNSDCFEANSVSLGGPRACQDNPRPVSPTARIDKPEFVYRMTLTNEGAKIIRYIEWEHLFTDPETHAEVARHQFHTEKRVRRNETKTLTEYSTSPPMKVIRVKALLRPEQDRFIEEVILKRIVYEDGSVWLQPQPR